MTNESTMKNYSVLDPDWDDKTPIEFLAENPEDAVRKLYKEIFAEAPPELYAEEVKGPGCGMFGSIGETRLTQFVVSEKNEGRQFNIYFS